MNIKNTAYTNSDKEYHEICEFLNLLSTKDPTMHWESGRMNFWRYNVHANKAADDTFFKDNVHIWRNSDKQIIALCLSEYGDKDLFIEVMPEYKEIYPDIFNWIENTWAHSKEAIEIDVFSENTDRINLLESHGFSFKKHFENKRIYDLTTVDIDYTLNEGFTIQAFSESMNYTSRVALVKNAFNNNKVTENNIKKLMASPDYIDEYHLSVVAPNHEHVAYCIGWNDNSRKNRGYIEPVGTHADYRKQGLAKAIIKECFKRMKTNGIETVEISSRAEPAVANYLYDSLAPTSKRMVYKYGKAVKK